MTNGESQIVMTHRELQILMTIGSRKSPSKIEVSSMLIWNGSLHAIRPRSGPPLDPPPSTRPIQKFGRQGYKSETPEAGRLLGVSCLLRKLVVVGLIEGLKNSNTNVPYQIYISNILYE